MTVWSAQCFRDRRRMKVREDEPMRNFACIILGILLISSCTAKVPVSKNPDKGMVAIPMHAENASPSRSTFSFMYKLVSSFDPDISITIYPMIGHDFTFSKEMAPGKYYFDKIRVIHNSPYSISNTSSKPRNLPRPVIAYVKPGTITVVNQKFEVEVVWNVTSGEEFTTYWGFRGLTVPEVRSYVSKLKSMENAENWWISGPE